MRLRLVPLVAVLFLAPVALASVGGEDASGDEAMLYYGPLVAAFDALGCHAPSTDILGAGATELEGSFFVVSIVRASDDPRLHCGGIPLGEGRAVAGQVHLWNDEIDVTFVSVGDARACADMWFGAARGYECGLFYDFGDRFEWHIDARGDVETNFGLRHYELGTAQLSFEAVTSGAGDVDPAGSHFWMAFDGVYVPG